MWRMRNGIAPSPPSWSKMPPIETNSASSIPVTPSSVHKNEQSYIVRLAEHYPELLPLLAAPMVCADDILIEMTPGASDESSVIGTGGQATVFKATLKNSPQTHVAVKVGRTPDIFKEFVLCHQFDHPSTHILFYSELHWTPLTGSKIFSDILKSVCYAVSKDTESDSSDDDSDSSSDDEDPYPFKGGETSAPDKPKRRTGSTRSEESSWIYFAVYEFCRHKDLFTYLEINADKSRDLEFLSKLFRGVCAALHELHSRGFVHCDIKPENILLDEDLNAKLADFGLCQALNDKMHPQGTPSYLSPEVLFAWFYSKQKHTFTPKIDIFGLGVLAVNIITQKYPYKRTTQRLKRKLKFSPEEILHHFVIPPKRVAQMEQVSPFLARIVRQCLAVEPEDRPTAQQILGQLVT
jgi:serine/threonine protein kinase